MAYYYPIVNGSTFIDLMKYNNTVTNDAFGLTILFMVFVIGFVTSKSSTMNEEAFAVSSFITTLAGLMLTAMGIIAPYILMFPVFALGMAMMILYKRR